MAKTFGQAYQLFEWSIQMSAKVAMENTQWNMAAMYVHVVKGQWSPEEAFQSSTCRELWILEALVQASEQKSALVY